MEKFEQEESVQVDNPVALFNLVKSCSRENLNIVLQDPSTLAIIKEVKGQGAHWPPGEDHQLVV